MNYYKIVVLPTYGGNVHKNRCVGEARSPRRRPLMHGHIGLGLGLGLAESITQLLFGGSFIEQTQRVWLGSDEVSGVAR